MRSEGEPSGTTRAALHEAFPELQGDGVILQKEVYAHFGLTFGAIGVAEHSMVNTITFNHIGERLRRGEIRTQGDWERALDDGFSLAKSQTFGNQAKLILSIPEFSDLDASFRQAKRVRDYLAHHFMREEAGYFVTEDGCWLLLTRIADVRRVFDELEAAILPRLERVKRRHRLPEPSQQELDQLMEKMNSEYAEALRSGTAKVGWDDDA